MQSERFPILAPVRFIPANDTLPVKYHTWPLDRGFFQQQIRDYQFKTEYQQKWGLFDRIFFYFDTLATAVKFTLLDEEGTTLATVNLNSSHFVTVAGNTASDGSTYNSFLYSFKLSDIYAYPADTQQVVYYFALEFLYGAAGTPGNSVRISEPQFFRRDGWAGTILFEYTNLENDYDIVFQQHNYPVMSFRAEGDIQPDEMGGHSTTFEDMNYEVSKLQEVPNRALRLQVGANEGVPSWVHDKVNRIIRCDKFSAEGTRCVKDQGAKWQETSAPDYPLYGASIQLLEYTPDGSTSAESGGASALLYFPTTAGEMDLPVAIPFTTISDGLHTIVDLIPRSLVTPSDVTDYLDWLNGDIAAYYDLSGHYEIVYDAPLNAWALIYVNGDGEFYIPSGTTFAWHTHIAATITTTAPASTYDVFLAAWSGGTAKAIIDWGNGVVEYVTTTDVFPTLTQRTGTYAAADNYNLKIYHCGDSTDIDEAIGYLGLIGNANAKITAMPSAIDGHRAPAMIEAFGMNLNNFGGGAFKTEFLKYSAAYLEQLVVSSNGIGSFENGIFAWGGTLWAAISLLSVGSNSLSTTQVNLVVTNLYFASSPIVVGGIMGLTQTPAAPPTGPALAIINTYTSTYGWFIVHD